ncbi:hypothetical protein OG596_07140 [Streptomyces sp. NBC_01102]|uniref:hypothetical protein n=1 Tax=Streptomyces sp. NBC_01102 TaxID=2903749 RepID=UPI003868C24F|nr:hypothetical protein OG596_07140 [Streptomyces sp. NBC_01102]
MTNAAGREYRTVLRMTVSMSYSRYRKIAMPIATGGRLSLARPRGRANDEMPAAPGVF